MGIEAAKDVKAAGTENIFNKVITKHFQNLKRKYRRLLELLTDKTRIKPSQIIV
jgi:hypothetical protein